jgi:hypothetical protein
MPHWMLKACWATSFSFLRSQDFFFQRGVGFVSSFHDLVIFFLWISLFPLFHNLPLGQKTGTTIASQKTNTFSQDGPGMAVHAGPGLGLEPLEKTAERWFSWLTLIPQRTRLLGALRKCGDHKQLSFLSIVVIHECKCWLYIHF